MRKYTIMLAAAPLALLSACGDSADDETVTETDVVAETDAAGDSAMVEDTSTGPATRIDDAGEYSGSYSFADDAGETRNVRLSSSDNTYSYTDADGNEQTGSYTVDDDGYRIRLADFYGEPATFAYRNDAFWLVDGDLIFAEDTDVNGDRYARNRDDDEMPSRAPELGSSVDRDQQ
ncbi:chitin-binding domain-containing protein [Pseudoblastomonas halimionae]|uniref:Lipoprotein n=1 Tax=Alteriqipengyuania halimionae TaxID=1926630 RepID=A0A6I4U587_9SPHN|nr:hypothetical protein [Alteriqipengyuania halimionae]MXP11158.1 hypothetical protein [Alteriqipengyuania halimionae]